MHPLHKIKTRHIALLGLLILFLVLPFKDLAENIVVGFIRQGLITPRDYNEKIDSLRKGNLQLMLALRQTQLLKDENDKLKKALDFKESREIEFIPAEIISFDPSAWRHVLIINGGSDKGIKTGQFVINEEGWLVGVVAEVKETYSAIILADDPDFSLPVFIGNDSGTVISASGLLKGSLGEVKVRYVEDGESVKTRDKIWVKIPSITAPVYVGRIKRMRGDANSLFYDIDVELFSQNPLLHKIFIVR